MGAPLEVLGHCGRILVGFGGAGKGDGGTDHLHSLFFLLSISFSVLYMQSVQKRVNIAESRVVSKSDTIHIHEYISYHYLPHVSTMASTIVTGVLLLIKTAARFRVKRR